MICLGWCAIGPAHLEHIPGVDRGVEVDQRHHAFASGSGPDSNGLGYTKLLQLENRLRHLGSVPFDDSRVSTPVGGRIRQVRKRRQPKPPRGTTPAVQRIDIYPVARREWPSQATSVSIDDQRNASDVPAAWRGMRFEPAEARAAAGRGRERGCAGLEHGSRDDRPRRETRAAGRRAGVMRDGGRVPRGIPRE